MLVLRKVWMPWGQQLTEVLWQEDPCWDDPSDLAHTGFSVVAMTLAEPLRKAFRAHLDAHCCGGSGPGFAHCPDAWELWQLLPDGDRIAYA